MQKSYVENGLLKNADGKFIKCSDMARKRKRKKKRKKVVLTAEELERERELTRLRKCGRCGEPGHTVRTCMSTSHIDGETKLKGKELCVRCDRPMHVHDDGRECGYKTRMDGARIEAARADTRGDGDGKGGGKGKKRAKG